MPKLTWSVVALACLAGASWPAAAAEVPDALPRTAVVTAFPPEWAALQSHLVDRKDEIIDGTAFSTGEIEGKPVVLFMSGISMVNAAMTTQKALDHFTIARIVFSGIAGGVDPQREIGDVVVPEQWSEYLETVFAREVQGTYKLPGFIDRPPIENYGMMFPQPVQVGRAPEKPEVRTWFPVDPQLLALARKIAAAAVLGDCTTDRRCLSHRPKIVVGGNGVSGQAFVDNAAFRDYVRRAFGAEALDMESAAVAHVAYTDKVPFIAFRSLSDLAGGDAEENQLKIFGDLAAANSAAVVTAFLKALP